MPFFKGWPIWQKLVFVLGCAIVITVLLGCAKLGHTHWKSTTLSEKDRIEQAVQRQMSQRRRAGPAVPFGIRAIESGIEIEGVWISRPNSPDGTREPSVTSSKWDHGPRKDFILDIETQNSTTYHRPPSAKSSLVRAASTERPSSERTSRDSSPDINMSKPARSRHPPLAYTKFTGYPALQQGPTMGTLEGLEAIYRASGPIQAVGAFDPSTIDERLGGSGSSNKSGSDSEPISAAAPCLLNSQRTRQQSVDLELRRMSQAAETGQLTPRVRREHGCHSHEIGDYFYSPRTQSPPPPNAGQNSPTGRSPAWSSQVNNLPLAVRKSSLPDVTPFTQFCMTAPVSPLSRPASPASSISSMGSNSSSSRPSTREQNTRGLACAAPEPAKSAPPRSSFERRDSSIVRGHGTGFETLQPGTFPAQTTDVHPRNAPPVSLLNSSARARSNSADRQRHKLQKKRRPSVESGTSSREDVSSVASWQ